MEIIINEQKLKEIAKWVNEKGLQEDLEQVVKYKLNSNLATPKDIEKFLIIIMNLGLQDKLLYDFGING